MSEKPIRLRYFTPREANAILPEVRVRVERAADGAREIRQLQFLTKGDPDLDETERARMLEHIELLREQVARIVEEVHQMGVEIKGLNPQLVDFPGLLNGQEVYLCWQEGEKYLSWWHPIHTGVAGRQPLEDIDDGSWEWCH